MPVQTTEKERDTHEINLSHTVTIIIFSWNRKSVQISYERWLIYRYEGCLYLYIDIWLPAWNKRPFV